MTGLYLMYFTDYKTGRYISVVGRHQSRSLICIPFLLLEGDL